MRRKLTFAVGFGVGYVLGARAGRARYDAIVRTAQRVMDHPTVQSAAGMLQAQAGNALRTARQRLGVGGPSEAEARWWTYEEPAPNEQRR
jgi:hypothetical protein